MPHVWSVAPLDPGGREPGPGVQLFLERAQAVEPRLQLDAADLDSVRRIVRRVDGLPLAIEMAARWQDLALTIHPHPTLSESIMEAAETFFA